VPVCACWRYRGRGMARLAGKVAFITGAAMGIGRATAVLCAREGAQVVVADIAAAAGEETAHLAGNGAIAIRTDVTAPWKFSSPSKSVLNLCRLLKTRLALSTPDLYAIRLLERGIQSMLPFVCAGGAGPHGTLGKNAPSAGRSVGSLRATGHTAASGYYPRIWPPWPGRFSRPPSASSEPPAPKQYRCARSRCQ